MLFLLTQHCTMGCPHCMSRSTPNCPHASTKTVDAFIRFARKMNTSKIGVSGGEPTSHPKFLYHFRRILEAFPNKEINLMSNGQFFKDHNLTLALAQMQRNYRFTIQICSIKGLYPEYNEIIPLLDQFGPIFNDIFYVDKLNTLETKLGRAKGQNLAPFDPGKPRLASSCFNLYNLARNVGSLKELIHILDTKTNFNFCKPMIDSSGNIHPGESIDCTIIGNIFKTSLNKLHQILFTTDPCGKCGRPTQLAEIMANVPPEKILAIK